MKQPRKKRKKIVETKTWTIKVVKYDDGSTRMTRINDGFNPMELMGMSGMISREILRQLEGEIKPDEIKRKVIVD